MSDIPDAAAPDSERLPKRAEDLIPHGGPMCVIDALTFAGEKSAESRVTVREGSPFLRRDGTVEETVFVEMIAQCIAARNGYDTAKEKRKSQEGYLVGVKSLKVTGCARAGDILTVKAAKYAEYGGFGVIEGSVWREAEVLAQGELKVLQITGNVSVSDAQV